MYQVYLDGAHIPGLHVVPFALALYFGSWLPVMYVRRPAVMYGAWMGVYFGLTQHAGLAEDVLDHRLNSRTVYMNPCSATSIGT